MSGAEALPERAALFDAYALPDRSTPRVRMNFVASLDGAATLGGRSGRLGDAADRAAMGVLRALADVVLVGAGTVRAEGYGGLGLDDDLIARRRALGLADRPRIAVVSSSLGLAAEHPFFADADDRPLVVTHAAAPADRRAALAEVADLVVAGEERVELDALVAALASAGLPQILCEGGPHLFGALIDADAVDELCLSLSPLLVGGDAPRIARSAHETARRMRLASAIQAGDRLLLRYAR